MVRPGTGCKTGSLEVGLRPSAGEIEAQAVIESAKARISLNMD